METSLSLLAGASGPGNVLIFSNISPPYCVPAVGCLYPGTLPGSPGTLTLSPWQELFLLSFAGQILNMVQLYLSDTFYTSFTVRKQADCWWLLVSHRGFENPHFFSFLCVSISMYQNMFASENWPISTVQAGFTKGFLQFGFEVLCPNFSYQNVATLRQWGPPSASQMFEGVVLHLLLAPNLASNLSSLEAFVKQTHWNIFKHFLLPPRQGGRSLNLCKKSRKSIKVFKLNPTLSKCLSWRELQFSSH